MNETTMVVNMQTKHRIYLIVGVLLCFRFLSVKAQEFIHQNAEIDIHIITEEINRFNHSLNTLQPDFMTENQSPGCLISMWNHRRDLVDSGDVARLVAELGVNHIWSHDPAYSGQEWEETHMYALLQIPGLQLINSWKDQNTWIGQKMYYNMLLAGKRFNHLRYFFEVDTIKLYIPLGGDSASIF